MEASKHASNMYNFGARLRGFRAMFNAHLQPWKRHSFVT